MKYIIIKKRPEDSTTYQVEVSTDRELSNHIRGTFDNTDQEIIAVVRVG